MYITEQDKKQVKKWITFSQGWDGCPIAYHLHQEGKDVILAQIQDKKELKLGDDKEEKEDRESRLSQYNGMLRKESARKVVDALKKVKNKDDYFIFCDQNNLFAYAEELLKAGFTKGLFPTKNDYEFEKNREEAMEFVDKHYPDVQIIPHEKYDTVEEAVKAVEESDVPLVIQSEGDYVPTICPVDDVEQNHTEILSALEKYKKDYSKGKIILKEKLIKPIEVTPQIVFWNGEPVFTDLDIETKNIGCGENNGNQVGCASNLIVRTKLEDEINKIAFPPKVFEMAKERKGIFVWDISLYFTEKGVFFGEFCSNRFGYDSLMTEMDMSGGAENYFMSILNGKNPLKKQFGAAIRVFNLNRQEGQQITVGNEEHTWLYEVTSKDGKLLSIPNGWDLGVITGSGDDIEEAVNNVYENYDTFTFKEKYVRTKSDFLDDYHTSIIHRYNAVCDMIDADPFEGKLDETAQKIKDIQEAVKNGFESVSSLYSAIKELQETKKGIASKIKERLYGRS